MLLRPTAHCIYLLPSLGAAEESTYCISMSVRTKISSRHDNTSVETADAVGAGHNGCLVFDVRIECRH